MSKIWSVIVGNGFTIDAQNNLDLNFDCSYPWGWPVPNPYDSKSKLLDLFPRLKKHLDSLTDDYSKLHVYSALASIIEDSDRELVHALGREASIEDFIHLEASHFLRMAYSWYSNQISTKEIKPWLWNKWFEYNSGHISTILSINYDLILEKVFDVNNLGKVYNGAMESCPLPFKPWPKVYWDEEPSDERVIHIAKPHGSCNFTGWGIFKYFDGNEVKPIYPIDIGYIFRDSALRILEKDDLLKPTHTADLILPGEYNLWNKSKSGNVPWAKLQTDKFIEESEISNSLMIIGFSCSEPDLAEFHHIATRLSSFDETIIVDPNPSENLIREVSLFCDNISCYSKIVDQ